MGRVVKEGEHKPAIFLRLKNENTWLIIDELMKTDRYKKSRNELLNTALDYGLQIVLKEVNGEEIKLDESEQDSPDLLTAMQGEKFLTLLQEANINVLILRGILCSLYQAKISELNKRKVSPIAMEEGSMQDLPEFLKKFAYLGLSDIPNIKKV